MNFFAPVSLSYERAGQEFGLAHGPACFTLGSADVDRCPDSPEDRGSPLQIQEPKQDPQSVDNPTGSLISFRQMRSIGWTSAMFALLQSLCTAVLTISGIRVAIGLSALAAASGIYAPARVCIRTLSASPC